MFAFLVRMLGSPEEAEDLCQDTFISMIKAIYLKGLGMTMLWSDALLLTVFAVVMVSVSVRKFKKRLE